MALMAFSLYRPHELSFRTQYAEVKERIRAAGRLLPGTPGRLVLRTGTGYGYWYRGYYSVPGQEVEDFICKEGDDEALRVAKEGIEFAEWTARQVRYLRKLEFQTADKAVARVWSNCATPGSSRAAWSWSVRSATWRGSTSSASRPTSPALRTSTWRADRR
jgi:hypothetical protein